MTKAKDETAEPVSITRDELQQLIRDAAAAGAAEATKGAKATGAIGPEITERPYRTIRNKDGIWCVPPSEGGPVAINGQHPDDFYGVNEKGEPTKNIERGKVVA
jgi:hypothetical protein